MEVSKEIYLTWELTKNEARTLLALIGSQNGKFGFELYDLLAGTVPELVEELTKTKVFSAGVVNFSETEDKLKEAGFNLS